jgi:hypothetical protein
MPKLRTKSSKAPNKSSRASSPPTPVLSRAAQWEQAVRDGDHEKIETLGRRDPNDPNDIPEKDTYVPIGDLVEGAVITAPAAGRPALTRFWTDKQLGEWLMLAGKIRAHFAAEVARRGRPIKWTERKEYIMTLDAPAESRWRKISGNMAETLATACWDPAWGEDEEDK